MMESEDSCKWCGHPRGSTPTTKIIVEIKDECEYWKSGHGCTHEENDNGTCSNEENCPKFRTSASSTKAEVK